MRAPDEIASLFAAEYGGGPTLLSSAPGRVNLIGEHTDYNDLPVLPIAIQRSARLWFRPRADGLVRILDRRSEFQPLQFELGPGITPGPRGHWGNYAKAPANELARRFAIWRGLDAVLDSDVPVASGLSSSSALVNAVGLALATINEVPTEPLLEFAELMAESERYTGTRGGGMDQAVSLCAQSGRACLLRFAPLRVHHVSIPEDWRFVVADSCVRAEKSGAAQAAYNRARSECEAALRSVASEAAERGMTRRPLPGYPALLAALNASRALALAEEVLAGHELRRFRHVVTEAGRVEEAADHLLSADLATFGTLMDRSHGSLHSDFRVSSPELDELAAIAREGGAAGARLTGAGFGGCVVALADRSTVAEVVDALTRDYFGARRLTDRLDDRLFVAVPSGGASVRIVDAKLGA